MSLLNFWAWTCLSGLRYNPYVRLNTRHGELTSRTPAAAPCPYESLILGEAEARIVAKDENQWQEEIEVQSEWLKMDCVWSVFTVWSGTSTAKMRLCASVYCALVVLLAFNAGKPGIRSLHTAYVDLDHLFSWSSSKCFSGLHKVPLEEEQWISLAK